MISPQDIEQWIRAGLAVSHLEITGDGQHFYAVIVSPEFEGKGRIGQHQLVYKALGARMAQEIHALSMQTFSPTEWQAQQG